MRKYYGEQLPEMHEAKTKVAKVHFLIHPGFRTLANIYANLGIPGKNRKYTEVINNVSKSMDNAISKAATMGDDEMMVAFLYGRPKQIKDQFRKKDFDLYQQKITQLKNTLNKRLIVISDGDDSDTTAQMAAKFRDIHVNILRGTENQIKRPKQDPNKSIILDIDNGHLKSVVEAISKIAATRGFELSQQMLSEAYGEEALTCVREGAVNLHKEMGLKPKTEIIPELTELEIEKTPVRRIAYDRLVDHYRNNIGSQPDAKQLKFKKFGES